jgi:hypothetical protein
MVKYSLSGDMYCAGIVCSQIKESTTLIVSSSSYFNQIKVLQLAKPDHEIEDPGENKREKKRRKKRR